jgi:hypothetical protein
VDPFFDRPYEPSATASPVWERGDTAPAPASSGVSRNIKPKRKVASLLGGS